MQQEFEAMYGCLSGKFYKFCLESHLPFNTLNYLINEVIVCLLIAHLLLAYCFSRFFYLSIGSTETKNIKLNTKTHFFKVTFDFCIHFKKENFFSPSVFLSPCQSVLKSRQIFNYITKSIFGFSI